MIIDSEGLSRLYLKGLLILVYSACCKIYHV
jgi:hypothetical protein